VTTKRSPPSTTTEVARQLGRSENGVRKLDGVLRPERTASGIRLYDPTAVQAVAGALDSKRAATESARAATRAEHAGTLSAREVSDRWRVTPSDLAAAARSGALRCTNDTRGTRRYLAADVEAWMAARGPR
jgi:hypothetical protein